MRLNHLAAAFLVVMQVSCGVARAADDVVVPGPLRTPGATFNTCAAGEEPGLIFVCRARGAFLNDPITPFYHGCWDIYDLQGNPAFVMRDGRPFCLNLNGFPRTLNNPLTPGTFNYGNCMTVVTDEATGCRAMASYLRLCDGRSYLHRGLLPGLSNTAMDDCARALRVPGGMGDALRPTRYVCNSGALRNGNGAAFEFFGRNFDRNCIPNNGYFGRVPPTTSCPPTAGSVALRANVAMFATTECLRVYANECEIYQESFRQAQFANNAARVDYLARCRAAEAGQIPREWVGRPPPIGPSGSDAVPGSPGIGDILSRWWNSPGCRLFTGRSLR